MSTVASSRGAMRGAAGCSHATSLPRLLVQVIFTSSPCNCPSASTTIVLPQLSSR
jgi:hypothetical protein